MTSIAVMKKGGSAYTPEYAFIRGQFALGNERLPYFSTSISLRDCVRYLTLARELVFDVGMPVKFDELFQRELSKPRARGPIVDYLKQPNRLKFFNAFTVVLIPVQPGERQVPLSSFPESDVAPFAASETGMSETAVGGVQVRQLDGADLGFIRWNPDTTRAVVVDGQHRFYALKELLEDDRYSSALGQDLTKIPILLLVLDPKLGFITSDVETSLLAASRVIFTDLNKHAVSLTRTREYLLDDLDLTSVSMRALMTQQIGGSANAKDEVLDRLPLAMVDWYSEAAKFDNGLHLTTVLTLHDLVSRILNRPSPPPTAYEELGLWTSELHSRIAPPAGGNWNLALAQDRLSENADDQVPFALLRSELTALAEAFSNDLGQLITTPLTGLAPYVALRHAYADAGLMGGPQELWLGHDLDGKTAYQNQTGENPQAVADATAAGVKRRFAFAYQVVFQKALVASVRDLDACREEAMSEWAGLNEQPASTDRRVFLKHWLQRANARLDPMYETALWTGAARSINGTIDYTQRGVSGLAGLLLLAVHAPLDAWPIKPMQPSADETLAQNAYLGTGTSGTLAAVLAGDPLKPSGTAAIERSAIRWWMERIVSIRPGPPAGALDAALRTAARQYRTSLRHYVTELARATGVDLSDEDRDVLVVAAGARRFAALYAALRG